MTSAQFIDACQYAVLKHAPGQLVRITIYNWLRDVPAKVLRRLPSRGTCNDDNDRYIVTFLRRIEGPHEVSVEPKLEYLFFHNELKPCTQEDVDNWILEQELTS